MAKVQSTAGPSFTGLVDLASARVGGRALATNDDFFAEVDNLVADAPAVFDPDAYTERGKWMDGWESRRKRTSGHDWAIVRLGVPGRVRAVDIDTAHFLGNHPPYASIDAVHSDADDEAVVAGADWAPLLGQVPLRPGSHNLFVVPDGEVVTHLRLNIFPDGGVARLRVYGEVAPRWDAPVVDDETRPHHREGEADLAAIVNGGRALACSDMFFGPMNNLVMPGRAENMGGGWETRRRRGPGEDWIVVQLGARGTIDLLELDTNHFKGNYPDRALVEGVDAEGARLTDLVADSMGWRPLLSETKLSAHTRHFFRDELSAAGPVTHVRLTIRPDGGVSRMRCWGRRVEAT